MKEIANIEKFYQYAFPMQAALLTSVDNSGKTNIITVAWHMPISKKPPLFGVSIAPSRYSHDLIKNSKEFVINFAPYELVEKIHYCGTHSGRNTDKQKDTNLTFIDSKINKTKSIKECFSHLECKLLKIISLGDHSLVVGEIVKVVFSEDIFENDILKTEKTKPCFYLGNKVYSDISDNKKKY